MHLQLSCCWRKCLDKGFPSCNIHTSSCCTGRASCSGGPLLPADHHLYYGALLSFTRNYYTLSGTDTRSGAIGCSYYPLNHASYRVGWRGQSWMSISQANSSCCCWSSDYLALYTAHTHTCNIFNYAHVLNAVLCALYPSAGWIFSVKHDYKYNLLEYNLWKWKLCTIGLPYSVDFNTLNRRRRQHLKIDERYLFIVTSSNILYTDNIINQIGLFMK